MNDTQRERRLRATNRLEVVFSDAEWKLFEERRTAAGKSRSGYVREQCLGGDMKLRGGRGPVEFGFELSRLIHLLGRLADRFRVTTPNEPLPDEVVQLMGALRNILSRGHQNRQNARGA